MVRIEGSQWVAVVMVVHFVSVVAEVLVLDALVACAVVFLLTVAVVAAATVVVVDKTVRYFAELHSVRLVGIV